MTRDIGIGGAAMSEADNPPAFPMTLRDWFAGQALAGFCTQSRESNVILWCQQYGGAAAYIVADAMLTERAKASTPDKASS